MRKFFGVSAVLACSGLAFGQVWNEAGDAGQNGIGAAQMPVGAGPLLQINGNVSGANDVDLYGPFIVDAANFDATTIGTVSFDNQLFLFDVGGFGVVHNDDFNSLDSRITNQGVSANGTYYIAISAFNADPRDGGGSAIFGFSTFPGPDPQQRMPNAGAGALATWTTSSSTGSYTINFRGVSYVPGPSALSLIGLGGLIAMRRRRG